MHPRRLVAAAVALAAATTAALTATPAQADPGAGGTVSVTVVDENGDPMLGSITIVGAGTGGAYYAAASAVSSLEESVPPGSYKVVSISPWGGILCAGVTPCDYSAPWTGNPDYQPDGTLVVESGQTTSVSLRAENPAALTGTGKVGSVVRVTWSPGLQALTDWLTWEGVASFGPQVTWLRDGLPVSGATGDTYAVALTDVGTQISAEVGYDAGQPFVTDISGAPVDPIDVGPIEVPRVATQAFVLLFTPSVAAGTRGRVRVEVTSPGQLLGGKVTVKVGTWSRTRTLINGGAGVLLPRLPVGRHAVTAHYRGTAFYAPSTAKPRTLSVTRG